METMHACIEKVVKPLWRWKRFDKNNQHLEVNLTV